MTSMKNLAVLLCGLALPVSALADSAKIKWVNLPKTPFEILRNDSSGVEIRIGAMRVPRSLTGAVGSLPINYTVTAPSGKVIVRERKLGPDFKIAVSPGSLAETGAYNVSINCLAGELDETDSFISPEDYECWSQDVFIYSPAARSKIGALRLDALASAYAPVLAFAEEEQYFPASLAYIFNMVDRNDQLADHKVRVRDAGGESGYDQPVKFSGLFDLVKVQGNKNYMIDMGYEGSLSVTGPSEMSVRFGEGKARPEQKAHVVLYYSMIPSRVSSDTFFLNYHTLYAYDSKGGDSAGSSGSTGIAGHAFDRESVTVKMKINGNSATPVSVIFGQHLADQTMAALDENGNPKFTWTGGGVEIPWEQAMKDGTHPTVAIARGSHAVFPKPGNYGVLFGGVPLLQERAGGGTVLQPRDYQLRDLGIMDYDRSRDTSALAFSGYWVTIFFGKPDAKFPPFTERETDPDDYVSKVAKPGRSPGLPALSNW